MHGILESILHGGTCAYISHWWEFKPLNVIKGTLYRFCEVEDSSTCDLKEDMCIFSTLPKAGRINIQYPNNHKSRDS